jgi:hypothetical protein
MSKTPIFDELNAWRADITKLAQAQARKEYDDDRQAILTALKAVKRPTKPMMDLIKVLDNANS